MTPKPSWGVDKWIYDDTETEYFREILHLYFFYNCNLEIWKQMSKAYMQSWDFSVRRNIFGFMQYSYGFNKI